MNDDGTLIYVRTLTHRQAVGSEKQALFLRISKEEGSKYEGVDLGILITPGRLMTEDYDPINVSATYCWPGYHSQQSMANVTERSFDIQYRSR